MCDMCCMIDFEFCSRDIGICNPITDRNLNSMIDVFKILGGILFGIPLFSICCKCFLSFRFCTVWFSVVGGVSCFELLMRCLCSVFCVRFGEIKKKPEEVFTSSSDTEKHGICYYMFCCCLFKCFFKKKQPEGYAAGEGNELMAEEEKDNGEDGEEEDI